AHAIQHHAGAISREMGPPARLPDGGAELRRRPLAARAANGPRPAAAPARQIIQAATARAERASALMRSTIDLNPFERCGVRCSRSPSLLNNAIASRSTISRADLPE